MEGIDSVSPVYKSVKNDAAIASMHTMITIIYCVAFGGICQLIVVFGILTNIINIICFIKQSFKEHINISLTAMAISDLGSLITLMWSNLSVCLANINMDLPFNPMEVQHLVSGIPHTLFTRTTAWITAFITLERCLCIAIPLKVNNIITSRRVTIINISVFVILTAGQIPTYAICSLGIKYVPEKNKTIFGIVFSSNCDLVESILYIINNAVLNFCAYIVIIVSTITLTAQLQKQAQWRKMSSQDSNVSQQNKKVAKLVIVVSVIFIACFLPNCFLFIMLAISPEFSVKGKNSYILYLVGGVGFILEAINSSVNIFVYIRMSTKYRNTFRKMFKQ